MLASLVLCTKTFALYVPILVSATWSDPPNGALTLVQRKAGKVLHSLAGVEDQIVYAGDDSRHVPHLSSAIAEGSIATRSSGPLRLTALKTLEGGGGAARDAGNEGDSDGDSDDGSDGDVADTGNEAACNGLHPNADDPEMLHVAYATDLSQVEGVLASVASLVTTAATPEAVTVHIMVQAKFAKNFKAALGLRQNCRGAMTVNGALILLHEVQAEQIERSVAMVSDNTKKMNGHLESLENYARFYMHSVLGPAVADSIVIYLDADTIVQADLGQMRRQLLSSNKTVGFVARRNMIYMRHFLRTPTNCDLNDFAPKWSSLMMKPTFNVGVFAVDLHRWVQSGAGQRVERWVSLQNECGATLWEGGSQPPLLLAFFNHTESSSEDFVVLDAAWNAGDLWTLNLTMLKSMKVLHWNGPNKPWNGGLFQDVWKQHRERFDSLLQH
eukprot:TRINITY_DN3727_c0_g2_i4.p1 TRINITY_DN3727_c0_g2~~TRINITY_DN3727_c0_g2_i4.p1  ORF type:complete len:442 (+),score=68.54 TRINITY_DN3727_c0_g2_i4:88-1413(+)